MKPGLFDFSCPPLRLANIWLMVIIGLGSTLSYAEDSAFLACARHADRQVKIACLEAALQNAIMQQNATNNPAKSRNYQQLSRPVEKAATDQERVDAFGSEQQARIVSTSDGTEILLDEISSLDPIKPNMWDITLNSGQVWRQVYPKRFELRPGDTVRIYPSHWGNNFRLSTSRLSGFIQVSRVK